MTFISLPKSYFDPWGVSKRDSIKTLFNYDILKNTLFMILLQFQTILLSYELCVTEKRTYVNKLKFPVF